VVWFQEHAEPVLGAPVRGEVGRLSSRTIFIGAALSADQIFGREPEAKALVARHFNSITPENILK